MIEWKHLSSEDAVEEIKLLSNTRPQVIFKHSTRCSISSVAKSRLERSDMPTQADFHYLDLIAHRNLSNHIASQFSVYHESPQVLIIKNGECIFDESHGAINMADIQEQVA